MVQKWIIVYNFYVTYMLEETDLNMITYNKIQILLSYRMDAFACVRH